MILVSSLALAGVPWEFWMLVMAVLIRWYRAWNSGPSSMLVTGSGFKTEVGTYRHDVRIDGYDLDRWS